VGVNAVLGILQRTSAASGRTYAVIDTVSPTLKTLPKLVPHNYERSEHWEKRKAEYAEKLAAYRATHTGGDRGAQLRVDGRLSTAVAVPLRRGRCNRCRHYLDRHGRDRVVV
jgi:hypothetical protein